MDYYITLKVEANNATEACKIAETISSTHQCPIEFVGIDKRLHFYSNRNMFDRVEREG
jgi:hypothetical protein